MTYPTGRECSEVLCRMYLPLDPLIQCQAHPDNWPTCPRAIRAELEEARKKLAEQEKP